MRQMRLLAGVVTMLVFSMSSISCDRPGARPLPEPREDELVATEPGHTHLPVFAGGCFWCVEAVFAQLKGVSNVVSGYAGGSEPTARYEVVSSGRTDHAEAVQLTYDPTKISYGQLLKVFFATHDPTQLNRQDPDSGRQYRSAIFYQGEQERRAAEMYIRQLEQSKVFDKPIVTTLEPLDRFYPAEQNHQDFVQRNPHHPYVRQWALPKIDKVRKKFGEHLRNRVGAE